MKRIIEHYDALINENNDPVCDPKPLQEYMNGWDGDTFLRQLQLTGTQSVLEIGVGTGRLALHTVPQCHTFCGIDLSPKTVERAKQHMIAYPYVRLLCGDFLTWDFGEERFDVIYSSLTFMHIKEKEHAMQKVFAHLTPGGRFVLSIDKSQETVIDYGTRRLRIYPDTPEETERMLNAVGFADVEQIETEFAYIFTAVRLV